MKKVKIEGPQDVFDIVKRRKWLMIMPLLLFTILTAVVVYTKVDVGPRTEYLLPDIYAAETLVIVEEQKLPQEWVKSPDGVDTMERLVTLQQQILSRSNLAKVVEIHNLYNDFRVRLTPDEKILALQRAIRVDPGTTQNERTTKVAYFKISYENRDPVLAMKVANQLAGLFVEYDFRTRMQKSEATITFLKNEVDAIQKNLTEVERKEAEYKQQNINALPDRADQNIRMVELYQTKAKNASDEIDKATIRLDKLKRDLAQMPMMLENKVSRFVPGERSAEEGVPVKLDEELQAQRKALAAMQQKYTDRHPDLVAQKRLVENLEKERAAALRSAAPPKGAGRTAGSQTQEVVENKLNPAYQELKARIDDEQALITAKKLERDNASEDASLYEKFARDTPRHKMALEHITRNLTSLRARYEKMSTNLTDAKLAGNMVGRNQGEAFRMQDPATQPTSPVKPKRFIYVLIAALTGVALGVMLAILRELFDDKVRTRAEIEGPLGLPVLVEIPEILDAREVQAKRLRRVLAYSFSTLLFVGVIGVLVQLFFRNYQVIVEYVILSGLV